MLRYEYQRKLLVRHRHLNAHKEWAYFKERPEVPADLFEIGLQVVLPMPSTPVANSNNNNGHPKKEKQTPSGNDMMLTNGLPNGSPSTHHLNQSAEIVILGRNNEFSFMV